MRKARAQKEAKQSTNRGSEKSAETIVIDAAIMPHHHSPTSPLEHGNRFQDQPRDSRIRDACRAYEKKYDEKYPTLFPPLNISDRNEHDGSGPAVRQRFRALQEQDHAEAQDAIQELMLWSVRTTQFQMYEVMKKIFRDRQYLEHQDKDGWNHLSAAKAFFEAFLLFLNEEIDTPTSIFDLAFPDLVTMPGSDDAPTFPLLILRKEIPSYMTFSVVSRSL